MWNQISCKCKKNPLPHMQKRSNTHNKFAYQDFCIPFTTFTIFAHFWVVSTNLDLIKQHLPLNVWLLFYWLLVMLKQFGPILKQIYNFHHFFPFTTTSASFSPLHKTIYEFLETRRVILIKPTQSWPNFTMVFICKKNGVLSNFNSIAEILLVFTFLAIHQL